VSDVRRKADEPGRQIYSSRARRMRAAIGARVGRVDECTDSADGFGVSLPVVRDTAVADST
jgi:hypothetical protein